ncbi:sensor histidine kinase [Maribacter litoralis]|uniref:sensor histidine kinase n=1 Tax=Maribacter litoralis TaxID=2059726 RepID=UPI003F5CCE0D
MIAISLIKKIGFRLLMITLILVSIKLIIDSDYSDDFLTVTAFFYYLTGVFFFMICWLISDYLIERHLKKDMLHALDWISGLKILGATLLFIMPLFAIFYYLAIFFMADIFELKTTNPWLQFRMDFSRASIIATTIVLFNLFYFSGKVKKTLYTKMLELKKEMLTSNYKVLKDQISPHFLFNSLNTLTSLMYEDRDLASDFTSRLASCYRYILDNRDQDLISLEKELSFLDSFIFMMDVRHKTSLKIETKINLHSYQYVIPTLCLQMLLENALKHNYFSNERPLTVIISNDENYIKISNNLRKRKDSQDSTRLGLENIKKRFSFYTATPIQTYQKNDLFEVWLPLLKKEVGQINFLNTNL